MVNWGYRDEEWEKTDLLGYDCKRDFYWEDGYYLTSHPCRLSKAIGQYELYKKILNIPGQIVELGVLRGTSLIRWLTYRDMLESPYSREVIGFDVFDEFPEQSNRVDDDFKKWFDENCRHNTNPEELDKVFKYKNFTNYELVKGLVEDTIPDYLNRHPELRISLLHLDMDVNEPTRFALERLWNKVEKGGLVVFDDYSITGGVSKAVQEWLASRELEKLPISHSSCYVVKK